MGVQLTADFALFLESTEDWNQSTFVAWSWVFLQPFICLFKIRYKFLVVIDEFLTVSLYQPNEFISRNQDVLFCIILKHHSWEPEVEVIVILSVIVSLT